MNPYPEAAPERIGFAVREDWADGTHTFPSFSFDAAAAERAARRTLRRRRYQLRGDKPLGVSVVPATQTQVGSHAERTHRCPDENCRRGPGLTGFHDDTAGAVREVIDLLRRTALPASAPDRLPATGPRKRGSGQRGS